MDAARKEMIHGWIWDRSRLVLRRSSVRMNGVGSAHAGSSLAPWCNWLTRRPLKAESSGSIPDGATNKINNLAQISTLNAEFIGQLSGNPLLTTVKSYIC
jgi:hypothetical protein